ncbi:hypothetical protein [Clostridium estertheticum]|uniref:hypothetical protein n=1 Tax=Clostridium estertheticum TaxID=238834 RepID=UPI001C6DE8C0|nr:hypothetical protein [Clostridium estertheticum]MBW9151363.1 hypothetical protein [Clostridium estertheticum]WLC84662.1 hypothetical protein KTC97_02385 [Clostridium estertheticum]
MLLLIVFLKMYKEKASLYLYAKYYIMACCLYIFISMLMIAMPNFKIFWMSIIHTDSLGLGQMLVLKQLYISRIGIDGFAGFGQAFLCSFGVLLNVYMIISNNSKFKKNHLDIYISLFMLIIGTLLYGRIGSLISFMAIGILIVYYLINVRNIKRAIAILGVIMLLFFSLTYIAKDNDKVNTWINWSFDYVNNYRNTGNLSNESSADMFNTMYFMPETKTILIGDGYYTDQMTGFYYKSTDVGFMRNILFFGVFQTIIGYFSIFFILIGFKKHFNINKDKVGVMLSVFFSVQLVVFEMKGAMYFTMYATLIPFYYLLLYQNEGGRSSEFLVNKTLVEQKS